MEFRLEHIDGLSDDDQSHWQVRLLVMQRDEKEYCLAKEALIKWNKKNPQDFKKILKVMKVVGSNEQVLSQKHVRKSANPTHGDVYEMRADRGHARLMFFYSKLEGKVVICTNAHWKGAGKQDNDFAKCARLKELYETKLKEQNEEKERKNWPRSES